MILDDRLDVERLMPGPHGELPSVSPQPLVLVERDRDPLCADGLAALADDVELGQNVAEPFGNRFQALVDVAKEDLVLDDPFLVLFDGWGSSPGRPAARAFGTKCRTVSNDRPDSRTATFTFSVNAPG